MGFIVSNTETVNQIPVQTCIISGFFWSQWRKMDIFRGWS